MRVVMFGLMLALFACGDASVENTLIDGGDTPTDGAKTSVGDASGTSDGSGPGTPTGRTGLEGSCDKYKACGGSYYATAQACIDAAVGYWGTCRKPQLDAFGDCMRMQDCSLAGSDGYIPSQTPCAQQYKDLASAPACK